MNYFISRDGNEYGPYSLADLQRYVASGNILLTDLTRSEGMNEWIPVSQVIGNIPVPMAPAVQPTAPPVVDFPAPPNLHWGIVLLLVVLTCGLFGWAWMIVEAVFVKRINRKSKAIYYVISSIVILLAALVCSVMDDTKVIGQLLNLAGIAIWIISAFVMNYELEEHYNNEEPIALDLSGVMTFFFNIYYFQYHFSRIAELKNMRQLSVVQEV